MQAKLNPLIDILKSMESAVLSFSGGVDSTFLLKVATLSPVRTMAVIGVSPTMPEQDFRDAEEMIKVLNVPCRVIETSELESADFRVNPPDRCFHCKNELFGKLSEIAESEGFRFVMDGSNFDDLDDWRPGRRAAAKYGVRSPLAEAGLSKQDIRKLSYELGLPTWDKPASPCLSSRFPYGEPITIEALKRVQAAENLLKSLGFVELRVRHCGDTARIELKEDEIHKMLQPEIRTAVVERFMAIGYRFVTLDLEGFRSGKLNEGVSKK
ncbi:MAG TPA: ATP-dependent sacrificial sulfur transferase LarE [Thermodesulfovibrionales bacterium]|nr:ATP-dependent sacrificial sulfur transferase LarE [Thermodesulfovibrionales bacterium]